MSQLPKTSVSSPPFLGRALLALALLLACGAGQAARPPQPAAPAAACRPCAAALPPPVLGGLLDFRVKTTSSRVWVVRFTAVVMCLALFIIMRNKHL